MLGTIPNRVTGFHQYSSLFTGCSKLVAMASLIANSNPDHGVAGSTPSSLITHFLPPAQCFVWHLEIFPTQNNGGFISIIFFTLLC